MKKTLVFLALITSSTASMAFNNSPWGNGNNNNWMNNMMPWGNQNSMPWNNNNNYRQYPNQGYNNGYGQNRNYSNNGYSNSNNGMFGPWNSFYDSYFDGMGDMDIEADFDVKMRGYGKFRGDNNNNNNLNYYGNGQNGARYNNDYRQYNGYNRAPMPMQAPVQQAPIPQNIQR